MMNKTITMESFYDVKKINFKDIDEIKLTLIMERAKKINKMFLCKSFKEYKSERYLRIMELINCNYREGSPVNNGYATVSIAEKFLLFVFSVDPKFEAAIIYGSEDRVKDSRLKIEEKFGVFDINLIKIEKAIIEKLLDSKTKNEIYEEIERRAFK